MSTDAAGTGEETAGDGPTELSYRHANPDEGNESVLLRFGYEERDGDNCLLVDAGAGVAVDDLLDPEDRLVGVCLTHAHFDHYRSLAACVDDDVRLFASPDTAAILGDVLDVAAEKQGVGGDGELLDALEPVEGWTDVAPGVTLHPLPAGHTPGAAGFLVRFRDGEGNHDVLLTGDFTLESCGGYPGFDHSLAANVEGLFLTGATAPPHGDVLTEALGDALTRAVSGGRTLVTAGALTGVHVATLLSAATAELDVDVPISLVGQGAKLYETLDYDHESVELVPEFADPRSPLAPGTVTVAGPDVPRDDSSYRLFNALKDDNEAGVVQLVSGGQSPVHRGGCQTTAYELSMHPPESTLERVVDALEPVHTLVTHRRRSPESWNDWPSCVWGPGDGASYTLYSDGSWQKPPWMDSYRPSNAGDPNRLGTVSDDVFADLSLPTLDRTAVSLADEGIDAEALRERVAAAEAEPSAIAAVESPTATVEESQTATREDESRAADDGEAETTDAKEGTTTTDEEAPATRADEGEATSVDEAAATTTADESEATSEDEESDGDRVTPETDGQLYRTAGIDLEAEVPDTFARRLPEAEDIVSKRARRQLFSEADESSEEEADTSAETRSEAAVKEEEEKEAGEEEDEERAVEEESAGTDDERAGDGSPESTTEETAEAEPGDTEVETSGTGAATSRLGSATTAFELDPLFVTLLDRQLAGDDECTPDRYTGDAVEAYLGALVREEVTPADTELAIELSDSLETTLEGALDEEGLELDRAVTAGIASLLGGDPSPTVSVALGRCESLLDAAVDRYEAFDRPVDVVDAAVLWSLTDDESTG